ncbi:MAG: PilX N-terminal domain-containing pilus assembly protein, partial [Mariprofundus sp.]|nr:PilX N-terminal domain-containing pilus assembly protein [Mariprofundus sp.]
MRHLATPTDTRGNDRGFVLVTSLILLSLLTLMSVAMFYTNRSATQTSSGAQNSTEAYYYAESAVNYIAWALINDAEF